jgi:hypothetical protein
MRNENMKKTISTLLLFALASCTFAGDKEANQPPAPKRTSENLYDTTDRWQVMFGLEGKLKVSAGRRDARATPADGDELSSFVAEPKQAGWYAFTFIRVDDRQRAYQVHTVRLHVFEGAQNSKPPLVGPGTVANQAMVSAAPGSKVKVEWSYNPGGEGVEGGWKLTSVSYSDAMFPPTVPEYEKATGE